MLSLLNPIRHMRVKKKISHFSQKKHSDKLKVEMISQNLCLNDRERKSQHFFDLGLDGSM